MTVIEHSIMEAREHGLSYRELMLGLNKAAHNDPEKLRRAAGILAGILERPQTREEELNSAPDSTR